MLISGWFRNCIYRRGCASSEPAREQPRCTCRREKLPCRKRSPRGPCPDAFRIGEAVAAGKLGCGGIDPWDVAPGGVCVSDASPSHLRYFLKGNKAVLGSAGLWEAAACRGADRTPQERLCWGWSGGGWVWGFSFLFFSCFCFCEERISIRRHI